jgi:RecQ-mediated genome instability protein 1
VYELLRGLGLRLRPEWLDSCAAGIPGFDGLGGAEAQARRCFEQFLFADMNSCGAGVLPDGVGGMHATVLDGPLVLQVRHCLLQFLGKMMVILCLLSAAVNINYVSCAS